VKSESGRHQSSPAISSHGWFWANRVTAFVSHYV
jgi:hypothetical protein